ncbi:MAG: hypothetical protein ACRDHY_19685, partial [Anaerolineales bacterium]
MAFAWTLPLASRPGGFPVLAGAKYTDLLVAHAPSALFLRQALEAGEGLPLWNPHIAGGIPFAADPLAGVWYPPNWLAAALPVGLAFNLILWFHLGWACLGAWRLARTLGCGTAGAWVAGIAYSGSPKLLAHLGLGHLGLVCGMSWAPWVLGAARSALLAPPRPFPKSVAAYARTGASLGFAFLADPRAAFLIGLVAAAYAAYLLLRRHSPVSRATGRGIGQVGLGATVAAATAAGVSAALWLPLSELLTESTRAGLSDTSAGSLALPAGDLLQLIVPAAPVSGEWVTYLGITSLLLGMLALALPIRERWFWAGTALAGWALALGPVTPAYAILSRVIPGMSLVRVPPRMLFLAALAGAVLAGLGADRLLEGPLSDHDRRRLRRTAASFASAVIILNIGLSRVSGLSALPPFALWSTAGLAAVAWAAVESGLRRPARRRELTAAWVVLLIFDLAGFSIPRLGVKAADSLAEGSHVASFLAPRAIGSRVLSVSYSIPQATAVQFGLRLGDGVHPLSLRRYWDRMAQTLGFPAQGYSVTLPPYPGGDPEAVWT